MQQIYSHETERAYLGSAFIDPTILQTNPVEPDDFHHYLYRRIYQQMQKDLAAGMSIDPLVLVNEVEDATLGELLSMQTEVVSIIHAPDYARQIKKYAERRELMQIASDMANEIQTGEIDPLKYTDRIQRAVRVSGSTETLGDVAHRFKQYMEERAANPSEVWGIPTPFDNLNKITGGFHKGQTTLIYGLPGIGKSVLAVQCGMYAATLEYKVDWYSLEMSSEDLFERMVAIHSRVNPELIHKGKLSSNEKDKVDRAITYVSGLPIRMSDMSSWTSSEIHADIMKKSDRPDLVIVDYLAKLKDKADNPHEKVEKAIMHLVDTAKDLGVHIIIVSSQVKDGTIKGTMEVEHATDTAFRIERPGDETDMVRTLVPRKLRRSGKFAYVNLKMADGLPMLEQW